ncbi:hypothetical protein NIES4072_29800 [Nostoc commune NIES-4072]|uniref:Uncharacterized protein n=1 Tax=Nostoc commune NIES-4072 TaxID=2005467 RepID=A0A2R5FSZ4_NOSCO|nr:hypothetical protein [Nostoc commune]BBD69684.1 hypothetical protein NIES4070_60940 [Nostoc commune HK-02]GBG19313.1 hypothetical protein NIES4072_29800 [Nostoc commune NIES-4072]
MTNPSCPGTWFITDILINQNSHRQDDSNTNYPVQGYENDDPTYELKANNRWDLISTFDGRSMYVGWCGNAIHYPQMVNKRFVKDDPNCQSGGTPQQQYDCINGQCITKTQYNTPGIYNSLADCQAVCSNGGACASGKQCVDPTTFCPDGKVCIDQGEFASIEALISKIGSEVC